MKWLTLIFLPGILYAQELRFELQPDAFPVEINGWQPFCSWAGGWDNSTPEFCDLDGDGDLDYFSGSALNLYWYFENDGSPAIPSFHFMSSYFDSLYPVLTGSAYESDLDFCDLDADGDYDVLLCNGRIGWAENLGDSSLWAFGIPDSLFDQNHEWLLATNMAIADIDADGDYDVFGGAYYTGELYFYQNIGTPQNYLFSLITQTWQNIQASGGKADPCFGDLDADGDLDLLIGTGAGTLYYYRNDGTAQNANMVLVSNNYLNLDVGEDASPELADMDADGDLDLFVGRNPTGFSDLTGDVFYFENVGTPQIADFHQITRNYLTLDVGYGAEPRLVDIDADGDPDLFSSIANQLIFYRNQGSVQDPQFVFETENFQGISINTIMPWFMDLDADGDYDLMCGEGSTGAPGLNYFQNQGTPQLPQFILITDDLVPGVFTWLSGMLVPATTDIDADGDQDLFISDSNGYIFFFENIGTPANFRFSLIDSNWQNLYAGYGVQRKFCFYDVDNDGDQDLFINRDTYYNTPWEKNLRFYRNVGTPQSAQMVLENEDLFPELMIWQSDPFLLDMDQDGDGDMFLGDTWGGIRYFKNVTGDTSVVGPPLHPAASTLRPPVLSIGPNPANPFVAASFELRVASNMSLEVFDVLGRRVAELASGFHLPGEYRYVWDAGNRAAGMYFVRLSAGEERMIEKIVMLK